MLLGCKAGLITPHHNYNYNCSYTLLITHYSYNSATPRCNYNYNCTTPHYIQQLFTLPSVIHNNQPLL